MSKVSILIPARGEDGHNLNRTLDSIYQNATGDIEVIVGFDGEPFTSVGNRENFKAIRFPGVVGIKTNINAMAAWPPASTSTSLTLIVASVRVLTRYCKRVCKRIGLSLRG